MPCGLSNGMPVGLQLLGKPLDEPTLLRVAEAFERRTEHHLVRPSGAGGAA
jgi:aspartyl-tRNA(Asn)/glutamyl-tRNA(Gln) amidotransferase subunit A